MRVALAQFNSRLGDVGGNLERASAVVATANSRLADLVVFPELTTHGYALTQLDPGSSIQADDPRISQLASGSTDVVVGFHEDGGIRNYNSAAYLSDSKVVHVHRKIYLPNYMTWEEKKTSSPGQDLNAFNTRFGRFATIVCNDAWQPAVPWLAVQSGAEVLVIPTNSAAGPDGASGVDTISYWSSLLMFIARMNQCWVIFVNRVGLEAGMRFWGGSRVIDPAGEVVVEAPMWDESTVYAEIDVHEATARRHRLPLIAEARLGFIERTVRRLIQEGSDL